MIIRAKAPLRIGLAGGGTDVSPYCDDFGGSILNSCINMYAYATIEPRNDGIIEFRCEDQHKYSEYKMEKELLLDGQFPLQKGVYNRIVKDFVKQFKGRAIIHVGKSHVSYIDEGKLWDIWNCEEEVVGVYWTPKEV